MAVVELLDDALPLLVWMSELLVATGPELELETEAALGENLAVVVVEARVESVGARLVVGKAVVTVVGAAVEEGTEGEGEGGPAVGLA